MRVVTRSPRAALRPFIRLLWVADATVGGGDARSGPGAREHALPTGEMHLVVRVTDAPLRIFRSADDADGSTYGHAIVAGPRSAFHIKDVSVPVCSVGAQLHPAASGALFRAPADLLAHRHLSLDDVWSASAAAALRERLALEPDPHRQIDMLEQALAVRLPAVRGLHPAVALALERLETVTRVDEVRRASGYSHRTFSATFRRTMGLGPKRWLRVRRMTRLLGRIHTASWADLASDAGFSDQAHFVREFAAFTGVTPTYYRELHPPQPHHVRILQDRPVRRR